MNTQNNPFVLPGLGQTGEMASNPMMASLEMMQQAWANLAGPSGLAQALPMNLEDLDRRLAELRTVENWLKLNQSMLASTIQGMEVQRATIATLKSFVGTAPSGDAPSPLEVALGLKPAPAAPTTPAAPADTPPESDAANTASVSAAAAAAAQSATQAWWNLMQQQFGQLASAAASTMGEAVSQNTAPVPDAAPAQSMAKARTKRAAPTARSTATKSANPAAKSAKPAAKKSV